MNHVPLAVKNNPTLEQNIKWVIFDISPDIENGGQTYFCGGEDSWSPDQNRAVRFAYAEEAQAMIEEIDPEEWLRDRLFAVPLWK